MSHLHIEFTCISNEAPVQTNPFLKHNTLYFIIIFLMEYIKDMLNNLFKMFLCVCPNKSVK